MDGNEIRMKPKMVNVRQVFRDKNPRLAAFLPGFVYSYLEKIVHQRDINDFLSRFGDKYGIDFARAAIQDFNVTVDVRGDENIPLNSRCIFACNHPLGGFDGILLMDIMSRYYANFKFLSNDILMNIVNLTPIFLPINKFGRQATESAGLLHEAYLSDTQIVTFPSGLVSRYINKQVMDLEWKKSFITKAVHYKRDVVPVHFTGRNSNFFYRLHRLRTLLGIKTNLEMFYLVNETYKHRNDHLTVTFGKPIPYTTFDHSKTPLQWAKWVKEQVYGLVGVTDVPM
jgi:1-acyl-sn-glycerol-3-phosphate acyltransferase